MPGVQASCVAFLSVRHFLTAERLSHRMFELMGTLI